MKKLALALGFAVAILATPAAAQQCQIVPDAQPAIDEGVAALKAGKLQGDVLLGAQAAAFAKAVGVEDNVTAVFLVKQEDVNVLLVVIHKPDGTDVVCAGQAGGETAQLVHKLAGVKL